MNQETNHMRTTFARRVRVPLLAAAGAALLVVGMTGTAYATGNHGGGHTPVTICHNGHTVTVDESAVKAHIKHGDTLGPCPVVTPQPTPEPTTPPTGEPTPEPTEPPVTETPTPEPTTPPTETPAPVVVPQVQDYVTCKGGAFVLDNTGSTVAVTYTINDLPFVVEAGQAVHTDADGTLLQPNSDYAGFTIKAGDKTWNFPSAGNCPTEPTQPPVVEPTEPPVTEPPVTEEPTPPATETPQPTGPASPSEQPTAPSPTVETSQRPSSAIAPIPSSSTTQPAVSGGDDTTRTLAYTGSDPLLFGTGIAAVLVAGLSALFLAVLAIRRNRRTRDEQ